MNLPAALFVVRCLVRDTFRQSLASRTFWLVLGLSGLAVLLCLSVKVEGVTARTPPGEIELYGADGKPFTALNPGEGYLNVGFGAVRQRLPRDGERAVRDLHRLLALWAAGAVGMLLVLLWTAGFLPEFLRPRAAAVLVAKPVPRAALLVGKFLGVLGFVAVQVTFFVVGTWAALGCRTGVWHPAYLLTIPLLLLEFAVLYSASALLAVWTRSTVVCLFGTLLFWSLCATVNHRRSALLREALDDPNPGPLPAALEAAYWVLPKPGDLTGLLAEALAGGPPRGDGGRSLSPIDPELSVLTSLLFAAVALGLAARRFAAREY